MLNTRLYLGIRHIWLVAGAIIALSSDFDTKRILLTGILSLLSLRVIWCFSWDVYHSSRLLWVATVLFMGMLSTMNSISPAWGFLGLSYPTLLAFSAFALAQDIRLSRLSVLQVASLAFLLPIALCCYAALATVYSSFITGISMKFPEPIADFENIRFFNQYQTWTLPFLAAALTMPCPTVYIRQRLWYTLIVALGVFFWALYWRTCGRGTGYATAIATLSVALFMGRVGRAHLSRMTILAVVGYLASLIMFGIGSGHIASAESPGRLYLWSICLQNIAAHPWLGIGPMQFAGLDNGIASHPHNAPLQWAVEWGLPTAALACAIIGALLFRWLRFAYAASRTGSGDGSSNEQLTLIVAVTCSLLAAALHSLVSGIVVMPASQCMLVVVVGIAGSIYRGGPPATKAIRTTSKSAKRFTWLTRSAVFCAALYVTVFTLWDYETRVSMQPEFSAIHLRNAYQPRYWADGTLVDFSAANKPR